MLCLILRRLTSLMVISEPPPRLKIPVLSLNCICNGSVEHCGDGLGDETAGMHVWLYCSHAHYAVPLQAARRARNTVPEITVAFFENAKYQKQCPVCPALHFPHASQNSRETRVSLAYSSVWELGWAFNSSTAYAFSACPLDSTAQIK